MRKLISLVLVLLMISAFLPAAFASNPNTNSALSTPTCPNCKKAIPDCICAAMKPVSTPKPTFHICTVGYYESDGNGAHTYVCSANPYHRFTEKCYSDNNHNHKCDHCAYVMSQHEFEYVSESAYTHKASCYCGEQYTEPCSFVDDKCVKCENSCRIYDIDSKVLDELNNGSSDSLSADSLRRDMLNIDYGMDESFRADISQQALDKMRSENPDIGISIGNESFNMMLGASFLERLDEGVYVESKGRDDGFAIELGSGDRMLAELDAKGISSHWGESSLRWRIDCALSDSYEDATELFSLGLSSADGSFAPIANSFLERERALVKAGYKLNTVDYPYAKTAYDRAFSDFAKIDFPQLSMRFDSFESPKAILIIDGDESYQLAPDDGDCYEANVLLAPGREISLGLIDIEHF